VRGPYVRIDREWALNLRSQQELLANFFGQGILFAILLVLSSVKSEELSVGHFYSRPPPRMGPIGVAPGGGGG